MVQQRNWRDISYLKSGSARQRSAFASIQEFRVLEVLRDYDPILVSTVCLDIDIASSDLDIICEATDLPVFASFLNSVFGSLEGFIVRYSDTSEPAVVAQFFCGGWEYEIFAQGIPVERQNAFRHLLQIDRVLRCGGHAWRERIRALKQGGMKTEPAVARCLGLEGDPYQAVLSLESLPDDELCMRVRGGLMS